MLPSPAAAISARTRCCRIPRSERTGKTSPWKNLPTRQTQSRLSPPLERMFLFQFSKRLVPCRLVFLCPFHQRLLCHRIPAFQPDQSLFCEPIREFSQVIGGRLQVLRLGGVADPNVAAY